MNYINIILAFIFIFIPISRVTRNSKCSNCHLKKLAREKLLRNGESINYCVKNGKEQIDEVSNISIFICTLPSKTQS